MYDAYGVAHITGETRDDVAYGAGWVTAHDRQLLIQLAVGPARVAVADVPGIDAFGLVTSAQSFVPSPEVEALVDAQWGLIIETYGDEGREIRSDAEAGAEAANAYFDANDIEMEVTPNDVLATTAFIGSIFGAGGGGEVDNAVLLDQLQAGMGKVQGTEAWEEAMFSDDPEAPTTIDTEFAYGALTGGEVTGSVHIDAGSVVGTDVVPGDETGSGAGAGASVRAGAGVTTAGLVNPASSPTTASQSTDLPAGNRVHQPQRRLISRPTRGGPQLKAMLSRRFLPASAVPSTT